MKLARVNLTRHRSVGPECKSCEEQLAFEGDIHRTYVSGIERGVRNPTATVLQRLAAALNCAIGELFS